MNAGANHSPCCESPCPRIYRTIRGARWVVRYRRCQHCGTTSKTVASDFIDQRNWFGRRDIRNPLLDGPEIEPLDVTMSADDSGMDNESEGEQCQ